MTYGFAHSDGKEGKKCGENSKMEFTELSSSWLDKIRK